MKKLLVAIVLFVALGFSAAPAVAANWGSKPPILPHSSWSSKRPLVLDKQFNPSDFGHAVVLHR